MSIVERLEGELGKPVLANDAVSLWPVCVCSRPVIASPASADCCAIT
jgi:maleate cis-trans isomerase